MSIGSVSTTPAQPQQLTGVAAQQAARAQYLRTGIDKDAAQGDPDHDAGRKAAKALPSATAATATPAPGAVGSKVNLVA